MTDFLKIKEHNFTNRLILGSGKFCSYKTMQEVILNTQSELVTVAMKRFEIGENQEDILTIIKKTGAIALPNTAGAKDAKQAVLAAKIGATATQTNLIKLEIHPDPKYLLPDPIETLKACEELAKEDFAVMVYMQSDPVLAKRLEDAGASALMPLASPIGTNQGFLAKEYIKIIISQTDLPVIIDAGLGAPSDAALAMEMGASAVMINTAIASSKNPKEMAKAFYIATKAGRIAFLSGLGQSQKTANATSPFTNFFANLNN